MGLESMLWVALVTSAAPCAPAHAVQADASAHTPEERFLEASPVRLDPSVHAARRARLAAALRTGGGGVFLCPSADGRSGGETFRQLDDFLYFTGLELPDAVLVLDADTGEASVFAPRRDARFESETRPNDFPGRPLADDPAIGERAGIALRPIEELDGALDARVAAARLLRVDAGRAGDLAPPPTAFVRDESPREGLLRHLHARWPAARLADAYAEVARLRMVKGPEEVALLRRAAAITCDGMREAAASIAPGVDERTLEGVLEAAWKRGGAQRRAFDSIVKSGPNALWPWRILAAGYDRRNRTLQDGELVIFDVGCELEHYASDVGRTFPVSGRFTAEQRRRLELSTAVADAVIAAVRPGVTLGELQEVAWAHVPEEERAHMQTGLYFGHHVGLDVGDPSLADVPLEPGAVFTVEPWYYDHADGIAVFVEDEVLVTEDGAQNLTAALPRAPDELERMVGLRPGFPAAAPEALGYSSARLAEVVDTVRRWVADARIVGGELLVIADGRTILHEAVGWRDRDRGWPMERGTIFHLRSMTKPLLATAVLMLVEEGVLGLDEPVSRWLAELDTEALRGVTVRQLLTHTAGMDHADYNKEVWDGTLATRSDAIRSLAAHGPLYAPGERFVYANGNSDTLAELVERVTGMPAERFVTERVLVPLGMRDSRLLAAPLEERGGRYASAYLIRDEGLVRYWDAGSSPPSPYFRGAGGLCGTAADFARLLTLWMDGGRQGARRLLSDETVRAALEPTEASRSAGRPYGMGWHVFAEPPDGLVFGHDGSDGTIALAAPERRLIVAYFTQTRGTPTLIEAVERLFQALAQDGR